MYLAANVSNPLFSPVLVLSEIQTGAWVLRQDFHALSLTSIGNTSPWVYGLDLLVGSVIVGAVLGAVVALTTLATTATTRRDPFAALWERASEPYLPLGIVAWEFARGKLQGDPVYRVTTGSGVLRSGGTLVDVGCGQGLTLSALVHAGLMSTDGRWPAGYSMPPRFDRLIGIELRPRIARLAAEALGAAAEIVSADALESMPAQADAVLFYDVLHLMPPADQERLVARAADALSPNGVILIREADPRGGWRFIAVRAGNRLKALLVGRWRQRFHFRTGDAWAALLARHGLQVAEQPANAGTPFANVLIRAGRSGAAPALHDLPDVNDRSTERPLDRIEFTAHPKPAPDR
jgi:SAM-dependent methyltransferase